MVAKARQVVKAVDVASVGVLVLALAREADAGGLLDARELRPQGPLVVVPREHGRGEPRQQLQVLDHDGMELHPVVALALVLRPAVTA